MLTHLQCLKLVLVLYFHSDKDPSGLLLLPPKDAPSDFNISPVLSVMDTLIRVAMREVGWWLSLFYGQGHSGFGCLHRACLFLFGYKICMGPDNPKELHYPFMTHIHHHF